MTFRHDTITIKKRTIHYYHIIKNNNNVALHTNSPDIPDIKAVEFYSNHTSNSIHHSESSCLYTSCNLRGSITLEAAIALPVFIFCLLSIIYIMNIMYIQQTIQIALEETARNISKTAYISDEFYNLTKEQQDALSESDYSLIENLGATLISLPYIEHKFMSDEIATFLDNSYVTNGSDGISFLLSSVDLDNSILDIVLNYKVSVPFLPGNIFTFSLSNRCYTRIYMGLDMDKEQSEDYIYVYYTSSGNVVHTNKYCRYLLNYSEAIRYNDSLLSMNPDKCRLCGLDTSIEQLEETNPIIYLTSNHEVFHLTLDCQAFTGNIFRVKRTSLENDNVCKECLKGK